MRSFRNLPNEAKLSYAAIALLVLTVACASYTATTDKRARTPYEQAKLQYVALSLDYDFTMASLEDLSKSHPFTQRQKQILDSAQAAVKKWAPLVRSSLDAWSEFGAKPANYDATLAHISGALNEVKSISVEVSQ